MSTNDSGMLPPPPGPTDPVGPPPPPAPAPDFVAAAPGHTPHDEPAPQPQETPAAPVYGAPAAPAYGAPAAPAYGGQPAHPYGGHPAAPTLPPEAAYGGYPGAGAPQGPKKGLVIAALVVSVVALLLSWVPIVNYVAAVLAVVGLVLGIIGLVGAVRHGRPGKGMAIGAVVVSAVSLLVVVLTGIAYSLVINEVVGGLEDTATQLEAQAEESVVADEEDTSDAPASGAPVAEELAVVDLAFGQSSYDPETWWYVVIVENPNPEHAMRSAGFDIEAIGADGTILDTSSAYVDLLPGRVALTGSFLSVGSSAIDHLDVRGPDMADAEHEPDLGAFAIADVAAVTDEWSTTVGGTLSGSFAEELSSVKVEVVARNAQGQIIGSDVTYVDRLPVGGQARFEVMFFDPLPADTTFEAFAML